MTSDKCAAATFDDPTSSASPRPSTSASCPTLHPSARLQHRPHHLPARHSPQPRNRRARNRHDALGPHPALRKVPRRRQRPQQHQRQGRDHHSSAPCGASLFRSAAASSPQTASTSGRRSTPRPESPSSTPSTTASPSPSPDSGTPGKIRDTKRVASLLRHHHHRAQRTHRPGARPHARHPPAARLRPLAPARHRRAAAFGPAPSPSPPKTCKPRPPIKPSATQRTMDPRC